jgi:hypothetical protein
MRVTYVAGVRLTVRYAARQWSGNAPRLVAVFRVDDTGRLDPLPIELFPGTDTPAIHLGGMGWVSLTELTHSDFEDWEPAPATEGEAIQPWLNLYPDLLKDR